MSKPKKQIVVQALAFASQLFPAIIGVLSFMLLVRTTQQQVLGEYTIYMAAVVLFEMIKSGGLQSALIMRSSGTDKNHESAIIGSAYWLGGVFSVSLSIVLAALYFSGVFTKQSGIQIFCGWYACLGIITLPLHIAEATAIARQDLKFLLWFRLLQSANAFIIAIYAWLKGGSLIEFATIHLLFTTFLLFVIIALKKTNPLQIKNRTIQEIKSLFQLIKYTLATLATTNLLKSADTFLIGSLMGPISVARYAIPLKLTELFEIPLRSLSTTAFPQLAAKHNEKNHEGFKGAFVQYLSWAYLLYIPALLMAFVLAPYIVLLIGGAKYADTTPIFRVFILFGLLLPCDRMTGISIDALQKPALNFKKVFFMAAINIIGDVVAIKFTHKLEWVAFASVLNALSGAIIGWWILTDLKAIDSIKKTWSDIFAYSNYFLKQGLQRIR